MKKILCIGYSGSELHEEYWTQIKGLATEVVLIEEDVELHHDAGAVLLKLGAKFTKEDMDKFENLKYVSILGTGYGGIDTEYAASKNIVVTNVADYATQSVAEFTFGIMLEYLRDLSRAKNEASGGDYSENRFSATEISEKNFGIVGLGAIGTKTAALAKAFGANVSYWSRNDKERADYNYKSIDDLVEESDVLTVSVALNSETDGMLNEELIGKIKKGAVVINISPMELVDLDALAERLAKGDLTFILDHADEMSVEDLAKIKDFDNCIIYPPIGYVTDEATKAKQQIFIDNIKHYLKGPPRNKVN